MNLTTNAGAPPVDEGWKKTTASSRLLATFAICFLSTMLGGAVSTLMSVYLPVAVNDLLGNLRQERFDEVSAYISSLFIFGWVLGGFFWGYVCDRIGRRKSIVLATLCYGLFTILTGFSPNWYMVMGCRFLSGFGIGGVLVTTNILIAELWPTKQRTVALGILSISIPMGIFSAGGIAYFLSDWRDAFLIGSVPFVLAILGYFFLTESTDWNSERSFQNEMKGKAISWFDRQVRSNLLTGSLIFGTMLIGLWAVFSWLPTWVQSISQGDSQRHRGISMMILGSGGITGGFISGWIVNRFGLQRTMLTCFAVCFVFSVLLFKVNQSFNIIAFVELGILALFFGISQGVLSVYIPQLYPTQLRAAATGFCYSAGRVFTGAAVFFVGALVDVLGGYGNAIVTFSFVFLIGFVITLLNRKNTRLSN